MERPARGTSARRVLRRTGGALAAAGLLLLGLPALVATQTALAAPGGVSSCPEGTALLAEMEAGGSSYHQEGGTGGVSVAATSRTSATWTSTSPVSAVVVKAATKTKTTTYAGGATSGTVSSQGIVNGGGQTPAISHLLFCGAASSSGSGGTGTGGGSSQGSQHAYGTASLTVGARTSAGTCPVTISLAAAANSSASFEVKTHVSGHGWTTAATRSLSAGEHTTVTLDLTVGTRVKVWESGHLVLNATVEAAGNGNGNGNGNGAGQGNVHVYGTAAVQSVQCTTATSCTVVVSLRAGDKNAAFEVKTQTSTGSGWTEAASKYVAAGEHTTVSLTLATGAQLQVWESGHLVLTAQVPATGTGSGSGTGNGSGTNEGSGTGSTSGGGVGSGTVSGGTASGGTASGGTASGGTASGRTASGGTTTGGGVGSGTVSGGAVSGGTVSAGTSGTSGTAVLGSTYERAGVGSEGGTGLSSLAHTGGGLTLPATGLALLLLGGLLTLVGRGMTPGRHRR